MSGMRIIVAGGVGAMPFAGVTWQVLHYLEGFRRLGHQVFYLEDTQRWPYDPVNETVCDDAGPAITYIDTLMSAHDFEWAYRDVASEDLFGSSEKALTPVSSAWSIGPATKAPSSVPSSTPVTRSADVAVRRLNVTAG